MREERPAEVVGGGGTALWATGADDDAPAVEGFMTLDMVSKGGMARAEAAVAGSMSNAFARTRVGRV